MERKIHISSVAALSSCSLSGSREFDTAGESLISTSLFRADNIIEIIISFQIHIYNQAVVSSLKANNECLLLEKVDSNETNPALLGPVPQAVKKLPFRLDEIPFFDTSYMCDPLTGNVVSLLDEDSDQEEWDAPLRRTINVSSQILNATQNNPQSFEGIATYEERMQERYSAD